MPAGSTSATGSTVQVLSANLANTCVEPVDGGGLAYQVCAPSGCEQDQRDQQADPLEDCFMFASFRGKAVSLKHDAPLAGVSRVHQPSMPARLPTSRAKLKFARMGASFNNCAEAMNA
jgi:hypothetical protein